MEEQKDSSLRFHQLADQQEGEVAYIQRTYKDTVPKELELNNPFPNAPQFIMHTGKPSLHRLETIVWKRDIIVNVNIEGMWYTKTYIDKLEASHELAELLLSGELYRAATWKQGRMYANV